MELISKPIKPLYFKYLLTAFGSAVVGAIYSMVDMAVVGQYAGPDGTSAIALILPVWSIICSLGILTGIGGSVIYGTIRGKNEKEIDKLNGDNNKNKEPVRIVDDIWSV